MRNNNQTFTTRRGNSTNMSGNWTRNRNVVRRTQSGLGRISYTVIVGMLALIVGLIYVAQSSRGTITDYEIFAVEEEIAELEAKKEDLAVEQARLTSIAAANTSEVAVNMEDASAAGYAN